MKFLSVFVLLALTSIAQAQLQAQAASPKIDDVFKGVTFAQPKCFGREYSRAELKTHPKQTVEQIKAKLIKYSADPTMESRGMKIEVRLKGEEGVNYHAEFSCMADAGKTLCAIECDGGSVNVAEFDATKMTLKSNGFIVHEILASPRGRRRRVQNASASTGVLHRRLSGLRAKLNEQIETPSGGSRDESSLRSTIPMLGVRSAFRACSYEA
jgi:hypothetical protein